MSKETSIIMSGNHPKLILEGKKTMSRRAIKLQPFNQELVPLLISSDTWGWFKNGREDLPEGRLFKCPYGQVGSILWVKETWEIEMCDGVEADIGYKADEYGHSTHTIYIGDKILPKDLERWQPSLFMPRWASRITLEITNIAVEKLKEITEDDCYKEGCQKIYTNEALNWYKDLWDSLNAKRGYSWSLNPWVWCISFKEVLHQ